MKDDQIDSAIPVLQHGAAVHPSVRSCCPLSKQVVYQLWFLASLIMSDEETNVSRVHTRDASNLVRAETVTVTSHISLSLSYHRQVIIHHHLQSIILISRVLISLLHSIQSYPYLCVCPWAICLMYQTMVKHH
jgi:hypothetical protein